jgi:hypothetical protein
MEKSNLEQAIQTAAADFALVVIDAIKAATLQELMALHPAGTAAAAPAKRGPGRPKGKKNAAKATTTAPPTKKKRVVLNYPKCAFPGCQNNRFPRGKGFCGDHWHAFEAGKIKSAAEYGKPGKPAARKKSRKRAAKVAKPSK